MREFLFSITGRDRPATGVQGNRSVTDQEFVHKKVTDSLDEGEEVLENQPRRYQEHGREPGS